MVLTGSFHVKELFKTYLEDRAERRGQGIHCEVIISLFVLLFRDRIYALQRQKERLEEQVDLANKALAESVLKTKK